MIRLLCLAIGYVFGLFQTGYFYGRLHGIDIRAKGSGNAGATNTVRVMGTKAGIIVLIGDMLKCVIAILLVELLFGASFPEMRYLLKMYAAAGVVLGHDFPFYLGFKGGKGIAATCGMQIAFHWTFIPMFIVVFAVPFLLTHFVSLGSLLINVGFVALVVIEGQLGMYHMPAAYLHEMYLLAAAIALLAFWQHRANIGRLIHGNEKKVFLSKSHVI